MNKQLCNGVAIALFALCGLVGTAEAALYTSNPVVKNFTGNNYSGNFTIDGTYAKFNDLSGWYNFGTAGNPLPGILSAIDPNFDSLFQIDSITISVHDRWSLGSPSGFATWYLDVGNSSKISSIESFLLNTDFQSFTLSPSENSDAFYEALDLTSGLLQFRFRETTSFTDTIWAFNASAAVNYSDRPVIQNTVPLPSSASLLLLSLPLLVFASRRRRLPSKTAS